MDKWQTLLHSVERFFPCSWIADRVQKCSRLVTLVEEFSSQWTWMTGLFSNGWIFRYFLSTQFERKCDVSVTSHENFIYNLSRVLMFELAEEPQSAIETDFTTVLFMAPLLTKLRSLFRRYKRFLYSSCFWAWCFYCDGEWFTGLLHGSYEGQWWYLRYCVWPLL